MMIHSMRSTMIRLAPASQVPVSLRGTYWSNFAKTARAPGTHSLRMKRIGPDPTYSLIWVKASVLAMRSGMMKQQGVPVFAKA